MTLLNIIGWFCILFIDVTLPNNVCTNKNNDQTTCLDNPVSADNRYSKGIGKPSNRFTG